MLMFVKPLLDAGFDCVAFDLPAHGQSTGHHLNLPMGADAVLAVSDALGAFSGIALIRSAVCSRRWRSKGELQ
jgi:pimeloyl-ACP methyl ester carboxylesterase